MPKYLVPLLFVASLIINIITCFVLWNYVPEGVERLPIHYNVVSGFDEVGTRSALYQIPALGFVVLIINALVVRLLSNTGRFMGILAASSSLLVSAVLLLASVLLVMQS